MIRFKKLRYKNFLSSGNVPIEIELDKFHQTLIVGKNGAGKTSILSALSFALFGKDFRGISKTSLVNSINKANLEVEVDFETNGRIYKIKRGMFPHFFEIYMDGVLINQSASSKDYQKYVEENVLKLNINTFKQIVLLGSGNHVPFMRLRAYDRREVIEELLDLSIFTRMNNLCKVRRDQSKNRLDEIEKSLSIETEKVRVLAVHFKKIEKESQQKKEDLKTKIDEIVTLIETKKIEYLPVQTSYEEAGLKVARLQALETQQVTTKAQIDSIRKQIDHLERHQKFYQDNNSCPTCQQELTDEYKASAKQKQEEHINELRSGLSGLKFEFDKLSQEILPLAKARIEQNNLSDQKSKILSEISSQEQYIELLKKDMSSGTNDKTELKNLRMDIRRLKGIIDDLKKQKEVLINDRELQNYALQLLKDNGVKTSIIQTYIPMMNKLVNSYLEAMEFYCGFHFDENFNEVIKSRHRDEFSYEMFSEGEKQRIDLAILFTWRSIARLKNSMSTNLLVLDETFDASLDLNGVDDLSRTLYTLDGTNIIVISHKEQMQDRFDRVLAFEKKQNFSVMKEVK